MKDKKRFKVRDKDRTRDRGGTEIYIYREREIGRETGVRER